MMVDDSLKVLCFLSIPLTVWLLSTTCITTHHNCVNYISVSLKPEKPSSTIMKKLSRQAQSNKCTILNETTCFNCCQLSLTTMICLISDFNCADTFKIVLSCIILSKFIPL